MCLTGRPVAQKIFRWGDSSVERPPTWLGPPPPLFASWHADSGAAWLRAAGVRGLGRASTECSGRGWSAGKASAAVGRVGLLSCATLADASPPFPISARKKSAPNYGSALLCPALLCLFFASEPPKHYIHRQRLPDIGRFHSSPLSIASHAASIS
jgi:hypothetical protein